eukprot:Awhi_evm1s2817
MESLTKLSNLPPAFISEEIKDKIPNPHDQFLDFLEEFAKLWEVDMVPAVVARYMEQLKLLLSLLTRTLDDLTWFVTVEERSRDTSFKLANKLGQEKKAEEMK